MSPLPLPRLELRWQQEDEPDHWLCRYRLFLPCRDMRQVENTGWTFVQLSHTQVISEREPLLPNGRLALPFRDGVHIRRDAAALKLPAYVVYGEHSMRLDPIEEDE
jgi:hypothetical protein